MDRATAERDPATKRHRLLVMSNASPDGGLASALEPALRDEHGVWLGDLTSQDTRFCTNVLWPLFHGFPQRVRCDDGAWSAYVQANEQMAQRAMELTWRTATVWAHDYQLLLAARALRFFGHQGRIGLFLHTPFPTPEVMHSIPWGSELVAAMCEFDAIGFQTEHALRNFVATARGLARGTRIPQLGVFPATIEPEAFRSSTEEDPEIARVRESLGTRQLLLGVDRLDHSKGIPERLAAFERLLERNREWHRRVVLLQISMPSEMPDLAELRERVEGMVGRINGAYGDTDWVPVRYLYRSYDQRVLAQLYRLASVALVTPLRDGMNLAAKEFVASQRPEAPGVLVLSQYAGAAETLVNAIITNPFHPEGMAADIDRALRMPARERIQRHGNMMAALEAEGDAKHWTTRFLDLLAPRRLHTVD